MKALISSNEVAIVTKVTTVDGEERFDQYTIPNSARVAQVSENQFDVHSDLFWVDCNNSVVADSYYYDKTDSTIKNKADYVIPS